MPRVAGTALAVGLAVVAAASMLWLAYALSATGPAAQALQSGPSLSIEPCVEANLGDSVAVAVRIEDVNELLAWEVYVVYDRQMLEVIDRDVRQFLERDPASSVVDFSDPVPNSTGLYRAAAADVSLSESHESGSGTLALVKFRARATGVSAVGLFRETIGGVKFGPLLTSAGGSSIGDVDGDSVFDGPISAGQVAIGQACNAAPPTISPPDVVQTPKPTGSSQPTGGPQPTSGDGTPSPGDGTPIPGGGTPSSGDTGAATESPESSAATSTPNGSGDISSTGNSSDGGTSGQTGGSGDDGGSGILLVIAGVAAAVVGALGAAFVFARRVWA